MYKTILVPLDGSARAEAILPHVENLAETYHSRVVLIRVIESTYFVPEHEDVVDLIGYQKEYERRHAEARSYLESVRERFLRKGVGSDILTSYESVVPAILNAAESEKADLVAIASHGRTGLARVFYGSVASGLLNRMDRPLLIIRSQESEV